MMKRKHVKPKGNSQRFSLTEAQATALMADADPRLTPTAARMDGLMCRLLGVKKRNPMSAESIVFLNEFDRHMRAAAKDAGIELREDGWPASEDGYRKPIVP